jgi:hypothetical protein
MRGGSQAWMVTASDGKTYVAKHPSFDPALLRIEELDEDFIRGAGVRAKRDRRTPFVAALPTAPIDRASLLHFETWG